MVRIRLRRVGRKNEPHYYVVAAPHTNSVKGNFLAKLGWYDPITKEAKLDEKAVLDWLNKGARPSERVARILISLKIKHPAVKWQPRKARAPKKTEGKDKKPAPAGEEVKTEAPAETPKEAADQNQEEKPSKLDDSKTEETKPEDSKDKNDQKGNQEKTAKDQEEVK